jgi:hypothetical protein
MNVRAARMNADRARRFPRSWRTFHIEISNPAPLAFVSPITNSREIIMLRQTSGLSRLALAACAVLLPVGSAFASQGPGGGMGTASSLTQIAMAVIVYGASALIVGAGLIGAVRQR